MLFCSDPSSMSAPTTLKETTSPTPSPNASNDPNSSRAPSPHTSPHPEAGIIAGAVIGSIVVALLAFLGILILYRRWTTEDPVPGQSQSQSRGSLFINFFRLRPPFGLRFGSRSRVSFHRDLMVRESPSQSTTQRDRVEEGGKGGRARVQSILNSSVAGTDLSISTVSSSSSSPTVESGYGYGHGPGHLHDPEKGGGEGVPASVSENWQSGWYDFKEKGLVR
jgi:hypothetical protein